MGNILEKAKDFLKNKNTVTILCVLAGILILYMFYNWRVGKAVEPIRVPYARATLTSQHVIVSDDIGYIEIAGTALEKMKNVVRSSGQLIGKKVAYGETVQQNSLFFTSDVMDANQMVGNALIASEIPDGYTLMYLDVDLHKTFGNAIYPGNYIDLWFQGSIERKFAYGRFLTSIKVLEVTDKDGNSVFESYSNKRSPAELLFAVDDEYKTLLELAKNVGELVPVPRNKTYSLNPEAMKVSSLYLQNYVLSQSTIQSVVDNSNIDEEDEDE